MMRLKKMSLMKGFAFTLLAGTLYAFGFPRKELSHSFLLSHMGMFLYFYTLNLFKQSKTSHKFFLLLGFSLTYNMFGYYWIPETLKEFGGLQFPVNYLLGTLFSLIIVPHLIIALFIDKYAGKYFNQSPLRSAMLFTLLEYFVPQQFPAHLGHTWLDLAPYLAFSPIMGAPFYSFLGYVIIFSLLGPKEKSKKPLIPAIFVVITFIVSVLFPLKLSKNLKTLPIRMVQANIGNLLKVEAEKGIYAADDEVRNRYKNLSIEKSPFKPRLIVWPETALPNLLSTKVLLNNSKNTPEVVKEVTAAHKSYLFTGGYDTADNGNGPFFETQYNTAFLFNPDGKLGEHYHKSKLIPFGESLPFGPLNSYLVDLNPNIAFFAKGNHFPLFNIDDEFYFSTAICYEVLFSSFIRDYLKKHKRKADFIINITNDSWYGDTAEPFQHKFLSHWRALEFNMPLVRMTNTGITNVLYQDGSESKALMHGEQKVLDLELKIDKGPKSFFQEFGILGFIIFSLFLILLETFFYKVMKPKES